MRYRGDAEDAAVERRGDTGRALLEAQRSTSLQGEIVTPSVQPVMVVRKNAAYKGVYWRIVGAALSGVVTAIALATLMFSPMPTFVFMVAVVIAGAFGLVTITLAMSARKEEEVHQLAASLQRPDTLLEASPVEMTPAHDPLTPSCAPRAATDGEVEKRWTADP